MTWKAPEWLKDGARVLGLHVQDNRGMLHRKQGRDVLEILLTITQKAVFSLCGKLVSHFNACGCLHVDASFIKRWVTTVTSGWDNEIQDAPMRGMITDVMDRVHQSNPVWGKWCVSGTEYAEWVDSSLLATGVVLHTDRSGCNKQHINLVELDAVLQGINLALQWKTAIRLFTDSACVHQWLSDSLTGKVQLATKTANKMLIQQCLDTFMTLIHGYNLSFDVSLVRSDSNKESPSAVVA